MPKVFVIVVTYKGGQWYDRCFGSLRQSSLPVTTIVVDNASDDGSVEYIREHFPEVVLIENKENLGFGRANNMGMRYALDNNCDYVFLLNQDAWIEPDAIEKLVAVHRRNPEYGLLSPMHLNVNKTGLIMESFCRQSCNEKLITDLYFNNLSDIYKTTYIHAAAWLLPKQTLQTVGGFDPIFFHYGEDDDYLHRVKFHNLQIGVCPFARIVHDHQNRSLSAEQMDYHHNQNKLVEYMDINHSFQVRDYIRYYLRKRLLGFCRCDMKKNRCYNKDAKFLRDNEKEIRLHREQNMQKGETWL